jgi:tetratricopeptide (TPR) repeat protein
MELYTAACAGASCIIDNHPCYREARQDKPFSCVWATMKHKKRLAKNSSITSLGVMIMVLILTFAIITITVMPHIRNLSETIRKNTDIIVPGLDEEGMYNMIKSYVIEKQYKEALELSEEFVLKFPESEYIHEVVYIRLFILIEQFRFDEAFILLQKYINDNPQEFARTSSVGQYSNNVFSAVNFLSSSSAPDNGFINTFVESLKTEISPSVGNMEDGEEYITRCARRPLKFPTLPKEYNLVEINSFYFSSYISARLASWGGCKDKVYLNEVISVALKIIYSLRNDDSWLNDVDGITVCHKDSMGIKIEDALLLFQSMKGFCNTQYNPLLLGRYTTLIADYNELYVKWDIKSIENQVFGYGFDYFSDYANLLNSARNIAEMKSQFDYGDVIRTGNYNTAVPKYIDFVATNGKIGFFLESPGVRSAKNIVPFNIVADLIKGMLYLDNAFTTLENNIPGLKSEGNAKAYLYNEYKKVFTMYSSLNRLYFTHLRMRDPEFTGKRGAINSYVAIVQTQMKHVYNALNTSYNSLNSPDMRKIIFTDTGANQLVPLTDEDRNAHRALLAPYYLQAAFIYDSFFMTDQFGSVDSFGRTKEAIIQIKRDICNGNKCLEPKRFNIVDGNSKIDQFIDAGLVYKGDDRYFEEIVPFSGDSLFLVMENILQKINDFESQTIIPESSSEYPGEQTENDGQEQTMDICESIPDPSWGEDPSDIKYNVPDVQTKCFYKYQINNVDGGSGVPEFSTAQTYSCREYVDKGVLPNSLGYPCLKGIGAGGYLSEKGEYIYYAKVSVAEGNYVDYPYGIDGNKICCKLNAPSESERSIYD